MRTVLYLIVFAGFCVGADTNAEVYYPRGGIKPSKGKVGIENVHLVTAQDIIARNTSAAQLVAFIRSVEKSVAAAVPADAAPFPLRVRVTLSPGAAPYLKLSYKQTPPRQILQRISDGIRDVPDLRVKADKVVFEIYFEIRKKA